MTKKTPHSRARAQSKRPAQPKATLAASTLPTGASPAQASIAQARDQLAGFVHDVEQGASLEITRRGKPVAVLLSYSHYQQLMGHTPSFYDALMEFRSTTPASDNGALLDAASHRRIFAGVRDQGFGRDVDLSRSSPKVDALDHPTTPRSRA